MAIRFVILVTITGVNYEPHPFCRSRQELISGFGFLAIQEFNFVLACTLMQKSCESDPYGLGAVRLEFGG
ncbi:hypothetical protein AMR41_24570 [Hapalosiphon sp. MRB220]|nr:hypothetical protein AMR41_24570 [Hapalosiphon sp. MRB220]